MMDEIKNEVEEVEEEDQFLVNINKDIKDLDEFAESFNSSLEKAAKNILGE